MEKILIAGFGGQGILSLGQILAYAGMVEGKHVAWFPSYGPEMRGGTANCGITISPAEISSPVVTEPSTLIVMNNPSLEKFEPLLRPGGLLIIDSALVTRVPSRTDIRVVAIPATKLADSLGNIRVANTIIAGVLIGLTGIINQESFITALSKVLAKPNLIAINLKALDLGIKAAVKKISQPFPKVG